MAARPIAAVIRPVWMGAIYGDWSDDPAKLETRVMYLLA